MNFFVKFFGFVEVKGEILLNFWRNLLNLRVNFFEFIKKFTQKFNTKNDKTKAKIHAFLVLKFTNSPRSVNFP